MAGEKRKKNQLKIVLIVAAAIIVLAVGFVMYSYVTKSFWFKAASVKTQSDSNTFKYQPQIDKVDVSYPGDPE